MTIDSLPHTLHLTPYTLCLIPFFQLLWTKPLTKIPMHNPLENSEPARSLLFQPVILSMMFIPLHMDLRPTALYHAPVYRLYATVNDPCHACHGAGPRKERSSSSEWSVYDGIFSCPICCCSRCWDDCGQHWFACHIPYQCRNGAAWHSIHPDAAEKRWGRKKTSKQFIRSLGA